MKIITASLSGAALDWVVAKCEGRKLSIVGSYIPDASADPSGIWSPSSDWSQGGPIIERECIDVISVEHDRPFDKSWAASMGFFQQSTMDNENGHEMYTFYLPMQAVGKTPLEAAMRCYVASKLGDEVEVPDEFCSK